MAILVTLNGTVTVNDVVTNTLQTLKTLTGFQFTGSVSTIGEVVSIPNSPTAIALPVSPAQFVYIKNTHLSQILTVTWTPNGGSSAVVIALQPGSEIQFLETTTTAGITALSLQGSAAGTTCEYLLAG